MLQAARLGVVVVVILGQHAIITFKPAQLVIQYCTYVHCRNSLNVHFAMHFACDCYTEVSGIATFSSMNAD